MSDTDLSDIGDVLAARFAEIGLDPDSDAPLNLPTASATATADTPSDLIAKAISTEDAATPAAPTPIAPPVDTTQPAAPAAPVTADAPPNVMAYLRDKYGADFTGKYQSDEQFLQGVLNLNKKIGERDEEAQLGRMLREEPARVLAHLQRDMPHLFPQPQAAPQPTQQTAAPADSGQFDMSWLNALQVKEGTPQEVRRQITEWATNQQMANSPLAKQLQEQRAEVAQLKQMLAQGQGQSPVAEVDARLQTFQQQQEAQAFLNSNADWLFTTTNGVRTLSPEGFVYRQALEAASQGGANFTLAKDYADKARANWRARNSAPAAPAPAIPPTAARTPTPAIPAPEQRTDWARDGEDLATALYRNLTRELGRDQLASTFGDY